jgi:hypothetical protein
MKLSDAERIAVLESKVADLTAQAVEIKKTVDVLAQHCPDSNDLGRRFQAIAEALRALALNREPAGLLDRLDRIFGGRP